MTDKGTEIARMLNLQHNTLLSSLSQRISASKDSEDGHVQQQLITALALLEVGLSKKAPEIAGQEFGAWLKIAIKQCPDRFNEEALAGEWIDALLSDWIEVLGDSAVALLTKSLQAAKSQLQGEFERAVRVLFIGDCLLWDASIQLQIEAGSWGIAVEPTIMAQRIGADLRCELAKRKENEFDIVIYSPFTYEFSSEYAFVTSPLSALKAPCQVSRMLDAALEDATKTIETLVARFECSIYVHTVSGVVQTQPGWRGTLKRIVTLPARRWASSKLDRGLSNFIRVLNQQCDRPVERIDENDVGSSVSAGELGLIAFQAGELHPTRLAMELARGPYLHAIRVFALLADKKLVVCDLDNTLWDGIIGEGSVRHYLDRQEMLLRLKSRGVLLAVASKNDPANVRWDGARLGDKDFVACRVNWSQKSTNILNMAKELNLSPASLVFLDDRPDEREMVSVAVPGLVALDPNDSETWKLLELWAAIAPRSMLQDRTRIYRERTERDQFLNSIAADSAEVAEGYHSLGLSLSLRHPSDREIDRVVELLSRTNQFNTTGACVTRQEIDVAPKSRRILIAEVSDKFGEMGIVGVLIVVFGMPWHITHFVLSCRVFGYGIEDAMLNAVKRWMTDADAVEAKLIETPVNGPCRDVYSRNGFIERGGAWRLGRAGEVVDPAWLAVSDNSEVPTSSSVRSAK